MNEFGAEIKGFGPLGKGEGLDEKGLKLKLQAAAKLVPYIRLVHTERLRVRFGTLKEYVDFFSSDEVNRLFQELIADKLAVTEILLLLKKKPRSIGEISGLLGMDSSEVSRHLNSSVRQKLARFDQEQRCFARN